MGFALPELATLTSEVVLSLYPILIKVVDTGLDSQLLARTATFATLSFALLGNVGAVFADPFLFLLLGLLNLVHIGTSYLAFQDLQAGPAMALFYTYPFMNVFLAWLVLGEPIQWTIIPWFILSFIGCILIITSFKNVEVFQDKKSGAAASSNTARGILAALSAAATEAGIYLVTRDFNAKTPFPMIFQLYGGALVWLLGGLLAFKGKIVSDTQLSTWIPLISFNVLIGFIGYSLRFWSIPRLTVSLFSILSFVGVASAYAFGARFVGEIPSVQSLVGSGLVGLGILGVQSKFV
jgi:drug/metabolite transporter (DMT)-like permease